MGGVYGIMSGTSRAEEIKQKVSIPMYFYNIIVPQITDYYSDYPVDFDVRPVACCPLHDEATPSMRFYEETNTFYCFGCAAGGDIIELHRRFTDTITGTNPSFEESVVFLYDYFIKGAENTQIVVTSNGKGVDYKSTVVEVMRLSRYMSILENRLLLDTQIEGDKKKEIWGILDEVSLLIKQNKANAVDSLNYIKEMVRELSI